MKIVRKIFDVLQNDHDRNITGLETSVTDSSLCILVSLPLRKDHPHYTTTFTTPIAGADPGFQVMWGALKKIAPSGGRPENIWGISCEKSQFYAKKSYFLQF
jgi:hypothetical protein